MNEPVNRSTTASLKRLRVGVWNYYEEITRDGFLFKNPNTSVGANLLKPWCDLYARGKELGIDFVTLDQIQGPADLDAVIFMDRPRPGRPLIDALLQAPIKKYLMLFECDVIKPDNWDTAYHRQFDRVLTWNDAWVDGARYIKTNFAADLQRPYDFSTQKSLFERRKLATVIAGAKASAHPNELYSERVRAIRWFEHNAPADFDLYGMGWDAAEFPSYSGAVQDKLDTLAKYRFSICYENAKNIPGYITEKALDCLRAGTVPVYGGAPNIERWIPADCTIDLRSFSSYPELYNKLAHMSAEEHGAYLDRIQSFLNGPKAYPFSSECFFDTVTGILNWDLRGQGPADPSQAVTLQQNLTSLAIEFPLSSPQTPSPARPNEKELQRDSFKKAGGPKLLVYFGYGDELPVFTRARALWQFFLTHYPNVEAIFARTSTKLPRGEVRHDGYDLVVGTGDGQNLAAAETGYAASGIWSSKENRDTIYRQQAVYDYLLRQHKEPFFLFQTTVTSVIDFRGLSALLDSLPTSGCFAGSPARLNSPPELSGLTFASGANSLFSSDLLQLMRERYDPEHPHVNYPNDIWQALTLADVERRPLPFFSFTRPRSLDSRRSKVPELTHRLLAMGHYHFRVKTTSAEAGLGLREEIDPWVMAGIMDAILNSPPDPEANRSLITRLLASVQPSNGQSLSAFSETSFFRGPRSFPLHDEETDSLFPDLAG